MYPLFASFIIFVIFFSWSMHRHKNDDPLQNDVFFNRERIANSTRKKSIADLAYIEIPASLLLPFELAVSDTNYSLSEVASTIDLEDFKEYYKQLDTLTNRKILNLTGLTNTDLKLAYGVANITHLISYDENYTILITTLHSIAVIYHKLGFLEIAKDFLEFSIQTHCDITASYLLLAEIYLELGLLGDFEKLQKSVDKIPGSQKNSIDHKMKEFCQSHDLPHS